MRRTPNKEARIKALIAAWDGIGFRCYYSGIRLDESDHRNPRYLTFDHKIPRREDEVVLAAACLNDMKSDMKEEEFRSMVNALAKKFNGGELDEGVFNLQHWKR